MAKKTKIYAIAGGVVLVVIIGAVAHLKSAKKTSAVRSKTAVSAQSKTASATKNQNGDSSKPSGDRGTMSDVPEGSQPFFGKITAVNGDQITLASQKRDRNREQDGTASASTSTTDASISTTIVITLADGTVFSGGTKDELAVGTTVSGYGTADSDGNISAQKIEVNPQMPSRPTGAPSGAPTAPSDSASSVQ